MNTTPAALFASQEAAGGQDPKLIGTIQPVGILDRTLDIILDRLVRVPVRRGVHRASGWL